VNYTEALTILEENKNLLKDKEGNPITYNIDEVERYVRSHTFINDTLVLYLAPTIREIEKGRIEISMAWTEFLTYAIR